MKETSKNISVLSKAISIDVDFYLRRHSSFVEVDSGEFFSYYSGESDAIRFSTVSKLETIKNQSKPIRDALATLNAQDISTTAMWEVVVALDSTFDEIDTIDNSDKWARSSKTNSSFSDRTEVEHISRPNETPEDISRVISRSSSYQDDWSQLMLRNDIDEEQYTQQGGQTLFVAIQQQANSIAIQSVVDNIQGMKIYGRDISSSFAYGDDDVATLSYQQTLQQSVQIISNVRKGDVPEFPGAGLSPSIAVGQTVSAISYPIIFRQLSAVFATDDSLRSFSLTNVGFDQDAVFCEFTVETRLGELVVQQINIE